MMEKIGRLAMRVEGENWNAYYALQGTMRNAVYLGSIRMALVRRTDRKNAFMDLMKDAVADMIELQTGVRPDYPNGVQSAPEHERGGNT